VCRVVKPRCCVHQRPTRRGRLDGAELTGGHAVCDDSGSLPGQHIDMGPDHITRLGGDGVIGAEKLRIIGRALSL
jgi:hypothetical protein